MIVRFVYIPIICKTELMWSMTHTWKNPSREWHGKNKGQVTTSSLVPSNWKGFLRVDENKAELFRFLSSEIFKLSDGEIISAVDDNVASQSENVMLLGPTDHEEADTRLFLQVKDMTTKGVSRVMILTFSCWPFPSMMILIWRNSGLILAQSRNVAFYQSMKWSWIR